MAKREVHDAENANDAASTRAGARDTRASERAQLPAFARDFPRDPALDALVAAYADGDFAAVRVQAPALAKAAEDADVKRAAETLLARTKADPLATWMLVLTAVLLAALTGWWIVHGHAPKNAAPPPPMVERVKS